MYDTDIISKISKENIDKWNVKKIIVLSDGVKIRINNHVKVLIKNLNNDLYDLDITTKSIEDNTKTDKYKSITFNYVLEKINKANGE